MPNKLREGKVYHIEQKQYILDCILEDNDQYCFGLGHEKDKDGERFQIKQYKQPLTQAMHTTLKTLASGELSVPVETRSVERGRFVNYEPCVVEPYSGVTLSEHLKSNPQNNHFDKLIELCQLLHKMHAKDYALGNLWLRNIEVTRDGLKLRNAEFAKQTNSPSEKAKDIQDLFQMIMCTPDMGPSFFGADLGTDRLVVSGLPSNTPANVVAACLILNRAGNNAYKAVIEHPEAAEKIFQAYQKHKNNSELLRVVIRTIIENIGNPEASKLKSFKTRFAEIRELRESRSDTPNSELSDASTVVPKTEDFQLPEQDDGDSTPPSTPSI